jgi:hypothetical protein
LPQDGIQDSGSNFTATTRAVGIFGEFYVHDAWL